MFNNRNEGLDRFKGLYGRVSSSVWILEITGLRRKSQYQMAFVVKSDGLAITYPWVKDGAGDIKIKARRVGQEGFGFTATVVNQEKQEWGLILLRIEKIDVGKSKSVEILEGVFQPVAWVQGTVLAGDEIVMIGNLTRMPESFCAGRIAYDCKDIEFDDQFLDGKCHNFVLPDRKKAFISSRFMGLVFNKEYFKNNPKSSLFGKELLCSIPIIQCYSLFSFQESAGAPIFNFDGELVGMYFTGNSNIQFGIHFSVIKKFVDSLLPPQPPPVDATTSLRSKSVDYC